MTAPIWMASPPEVHSALLSSGPGAGPLLAAASAWTALAGEYAAAAEQLTAVLATVQATAWQGPAAERYVGAHGPYLNWLLHSVGTSTVSAGLHQTAAAAHTTALATMPTLAELGANHAVRAALIGTNFFGINTIPIAVNEADYVRMWVQAASTMTVYHAITQSALTAVPATTPAPPIVVPGGGASALSSTASAPAADTARHLDTADASATEQQASTGWDQQIADWLTHINMDFLDVWATWLWKNLFGLDGYPIAAYPFASAVGQMLAQIPGMSPILAAALGWSVFHTLMLVWPLGQAALIMGIPVALVAVPALAAGGMVGLSGLAGLTGAETPAVDAPAVAATPAPAPALAAAAPGGVSASTAAPASAPAPAAPGAAGMGAGSVGGGPGAGLGPTHSAASSAVLTDPLYVATATGLSAQRTAGSRREARRPAPDPADESAPDPLVAAAATRGGAKARRRRGMAAADRGYRYEFLDQEPDVSTAPHGDHAAHAASGRGAGPFGFAGAATKAAVTAAAGLTTLAGGEWSNGPTVPMVPSSWGERTG